MRALTTILLLLTATVAFSQRGRLKGQVLDNEQNPFAGLTIKLLEGDSVIASTVTDRNGDFNIEWVQAGRYKLILQHLGFRTRIIEDVAIPASETRQLNITHPGPCLASERICPRGHTNDLIPIVYGLPGKRLMKKSKKGQIRLGGCVVTDCDPKWYCKVHELEF